MSKKRISSTSHTTRLYSRNESHVKKMVRDFGHENTKYRNVTAAIRHYVELGIATEKRTEGLTSVESRIVKTSQKEVIIETIRPLTKEIDRLTNIIEDLREENKDLRSGQFDIIQLLKPLSFLLKKCLHNILILRSVFYVFSLGYKSKDISSFTIKDWNNLVVAINNKTITLTEEELKRSAEEETDINLLNNNVRDAFKLVKNSKKTEQKDS